MAQEYFTTIYFKDFLQGAFTLERPTNPVMLGYSATISIKKTDNGVTVQSVTGETNAYIKNFNIDLISNSKFVCNLNWNIHKETNKYCLYKNNNKIQDEIHTNTKIDFSNYDNGIYNFRIGCLSPSNFIKHATNSYVYTYPFLNIPIETNYKYYFYYAIENWDDDFFLGGMLEPIAIDSYAASLIKEDKPEWLIQETDIGFRTRKHYWDAPLLDPLQDNGVLRTDDYIYFTDDDYSLEGYPPAYFILQLTKHLGIDDTVPIINKIDIYKEKISENDEDIEEDIGGDF